jgi:zeaxanthin glucosyltransferase
MLATSFSGHLNPAFALARELEVAGHAVTFAGAGRASGPVARQGFRFVTVAFVERLTPPAENRGDRWFVRWSGLRRTASELPDAAAQAVDQARALVRQLAPDLLVFDPFLLPLYPAFHGTRVPAVVLSTNPWLGPDASVPPFTSGVVPGGARGGLLRVRFATAAAWVRFGTAWIASAATRLATGYSLARVARALSRETRFPLRRERLLRPWLHDFALRSVPEVVLDAPEFDFPRARPLPARVRYAGPCVDFARREPPFDWAALPSGGSLVLCSLGTVPAAGARGRAGFLRRVARAVGGDPSIILVMVTGSGAMSRLVGPVPPNVVVLEAVPQLEVLSRADAMLTHGGFNSVKECAAMGVPMLVYPLRADQAGNAARVVFHGLGLRGSLRRDSAAQLRRKLHTLLEDEGYRGRAAVMRARLDGYRVRPGGAAALLESVRASAPDHASGSAVR